MIARICRQAAVLHDQQYLTCGKVRSATLTAPRSCRQHWQYQARHPRREMLQAPRKAHQVFRPQHQTITHKLQRLPIRQHLEFVQLCCLPFLQRFLFLRQTLRLLVHFKEAVKTMNLSSSHTRRNLRYQTTLQDRHFHQAQLWS